MKEDNTLNKEEESMNICVGTARHGASRLVTLEIGPPLDVKMKMHPIMAEDIAGKLLENAEKARKMVN